MIIRELLILKMTRENFNTGLIGASPEYERWYYSASRADRFDGVDYRRKRTGKKLSQRQFTPQLRANKTSLQSMSHLKNNRKWIIRTKKARLQALVMRKDILNSKWRTFLWWNQMPLVLQVKFLRVESGEFMRVGSGITKKVNVRVIADE